MARRIRCYGNTKAVVIGRHTGPELRRIADILEKDDYERRNRASCAPPSFQLYLPYPKLYKERVQALGLPVKGMKTGFLDLPGELRNTIYRQILVLKRPIEFLAITSQTTKNAPYRAAGYSASRYFEVQHLLGLLRTCKTVEGEASDIFYGENEFRFTGTHGAYYLRAFM